MTRTELHDALMDLHDANYNAQRATGGRSLRFNTTAYTKTAKLIMSGATTDVLLTACRMPDPVVQQFITDHAAELQ